jgi:galactitol-specific phosphotransferase system IIB component
MSSLSAPPPPPPVKAGLNIKVAGEPTGKGGKPQVLKPGKPPKMGSVLKKRSALSPVAKVGVGIVVIAIAVAGVFFYRIFFPAPRPVIQTRPQPVAAPVVKDIKSAAADASAAAAKAASTPKLADVVVTTKATEQAKVDAAAEGQDVPTPTPASESVMAQSNISADVKVNNTHIDAAPAASPSFRAFVASASIGGVFQGSPARALINGTIVREGQLVESALGISFERIDSAEKVIYFKDTTGAEVSKNY